MSKNTSLFILYWVHLLADRLAPGHMFPTQLNDSFAALKWVTLLLQDVPTPPLNRFDRLLRMSTHFLFLSRRDSFLEGVQLVAVLPQAYRFACAMTPRFPTYVSLVYTSLPQCWRTSMQILSSHILVVKYIIALTTEPGSPMSCSLWSKTKMHHL